MQKLETQHKFDLSIAGLAGAGVITLPEWALAPICFIVVLIYAALTIRK